MPFVKGLGFIGAFSYFFDQEPEDPLGRSFFRIRPPLQADSQTTRSGTKRGGSIGSISSSRTLELYKEPGQVGVELVASTSPNDLEVYAKEWSAVYPGTITEPIDHSEPAWVSSASRLIEQEGRRLYFFDVEQPHALPGCMFDVEESGSMVDGLVRALKATAGWIQIAWRDYDWTQYIEAASMAFQATVDEINAGIEANVPQFAGISTSGGAPLPRISQSKQTRPHPSSGSSVHVHGDRIAREYFEKAQHRPIAVSVRGMVVGDATTIDHILSALSSVMISYDYLAPWLYNDPRMIRWLRKRDMPNPAKMLDLHARGGFLHDWGQGRELIPVLCVTNEELPVLVQLPRDPQLLGVVDYTRSQGVPTSTSKRRGIRVGE